MPSKAIRKIVQAPLLTGLLATLLAAGLYVLPPVRHSVFLQAVDNRLADAMFRLRGATPTSGQVVIVDIDEKSIARLGQWPWPRTVMAALVNRMAAAGARTIGFDIVFAEPDRTSPAAIAASLPPGVLPEEVRRQLASLPDNDQVLADAIGQAPVVLGYIFETGTAAGTGSDTPFPAIRIQPRPPTVPLAEMLLPGAKGVILNTPTIAVAETEGFLNVFPDPSGTVRRAPLFILYQGIPYPSMAFEVFRSGSGLDAATLVTTGNPTPRGWPLAGIETGGRFIPTDETGRLVLNFRGPARTFPYLPAVDVLDGKADAQLRDKFVLIGTSAAGLLDLRATPFASVCPGVEVNATIIDNLLAGDPLRHDQLTEQGVTFLALVGGGLLLTMLLTAGGPVAGGSAGIALLALLAGGDYWFLFRRDVLIGITYPVLGLTAIFLIVTLANYLWAGRQKRFIETAFSRYVSPQVVRQLVADPERLQLAGEQRETSILFSDIRGFTTLSETMDPGDLGRFMNIYLTEMSDIIMAHGGMVDKFIGDAIMAVWGAPVADGQHADKAVRAALAMRDRLAELRPQWEAQGLPRIAIGVGINSGVVSAGNFGSRQRFDYTVIGDEVNLASRLEGANKAYGTTVIISEQTRERISAPLVCRFLDLVRVKGKHRPVRIYEPLLFGEPESGLKAELAQYEEAVARYRQQEFAAARERFAALAAAHPHPLYDLYRQRCEHFLAEPPPADWDGVFVFTSK